MVSSLVLPTTDTVHVNGKKNPLAGASQELLDYYQTLWESDISEPDDLARLIYLLVELKVKLPTLLVRHVPFGNELSKAFEGLGSIASMDEIGPLYRQGQSFGTGTRAEVVEILFRLIEPRVTNLHPSEKIKVLKSIQEIAAAGNDAAMTSYGDIDFGTEYPELEIEKFNSGFLPADMVTEGFYQSLVVFMATPGTGKTSLMLTIMEELLLKGHPCWFFENELPHPIMLARTTQMRKRLGKVPHGRIFCGPYDVYTIRDMVKADPDPNRIIFFDSPDVNAGPKTGERRLDLEEAYRVLIQLKMESKMVMVASQPRRADTELTMKSVAESWAKAWYADIMFGLHKQGVNVLQLSVLKNRFGPNLRKIFFHYDYKAMTWDLSGPGLDDWSDIPGQVVEATDDDY